jgi:hypothetical protein
MKLLIMQFSPASFLFSPLHPKILNTYPHIVSLIHSGFVGLDM